MGSPKATHTEILKGGILLPRVLVSIQARLQRVLKLTDRRVSRTLGVTRGQLLGEDWRACNGGGEEALLARAARHFDALITADQNLPHQQNLSKLPIAVVVLSAKTNTIGALAPLVGKLEAALATLPPNSLIVISG